MIAVLAEAAKTKKRKLLRMNNNHLSFHILIAGSFV